MSNAQGNGGNEQQQAPLIINGQYIKDLSFESPNSPMILTELQNKQPSINVNFNVSTANLQSDGKPANAHEVVLEIQAEMKLDNKVGFLVELKYAGVFTVNVPAEHLNAVLLIECPRILFPFARQVLSDVTQGGGFMPLMLQPIDFGAMYQANANKQLSDLDAEVADIVANKDSSEN